MAWSFVTVTPRRVSGSAVVVTRQAVAARSVRVRRRRSPIVTTLNRLDFGLSRNSALLILFL